jgi:hypothetical protein
MPATATAMRRRWAGRRGAHTGIAGPRDRELRGDMRGLSLFAVGRELREQTGGQFHLVAERAPQGEVIVDGH